MDNKLFRCSTEIKIVQSSVKKLNPQFSLCDVLVCYHGDNRNMTSLPKKVIEENLTRFMECLLLASGFTN